MTNLERLYDAAGRLNASKIQITLLDDKGQRIVAPFSILVDGQSDDEGLQKALNLAADCFVANALLKEEGYNEIIQRKGY